MPPVQYTSREDSGVQMIAIQDGDNRYEFPFDQSVNEDDKQQWIEEKLTELKIRSLIALGVNKDNVYMNQSKVRTDVNVNLSEADTLLNQLIAAFPQYTLDQLRSAYPANIIGSYGNYRPPYNNDSISVYFFQPPPQDILDSYQVGSVYGDSLLPWYGLKHDMTTLDISAKIVFRPENYSSILNNPPEVRFNPSNFFARIHNVDGSISDWVDMYVMENSNYMREYCQSVGKTYPIPDSVTDIPWIFSIVFNDVTGEINNIKGYVRS